MAMCRRQRPIFSATSAAPASFAPRNFAVLRVFCTFGVNPKALSVTHVNVFLWRKRSLFTPLHVKAGDGALQASPSQINRAPSSVLNSKLQSSKPTISSTAQTQILNAKKWFHERSSVAFYLLWSLHVIF